MIDGFVVLGILQESFCDKPMDMKPTVFIVEAQHH